MRAMTPPFERFCGPPTEEEFNEETLRLIALRTKPLSLPELHMTAGFRALIQRPVLTNFELHLPTPMTTDTAVQEVLLSVPALGKMLFDALETIRQLAVNDQAVLEAAVCLDDLLKTIEPYGDEIWGMRDMRHGIHALLTVLRAPVFDVDGFLFDARKLLDLAEEFESRVNTSIAPSQIGGGDYIAGTDILTQAAASAQHPASAEGQNPKVANSGFSGQHADANGRVYSLKEMAADPVFKDPTQATMLKGGFKPADLAIAVSGGEPEVAAKMEELGFNVVQVDPTAQSERNNALLTAFVEATDRATQLGFKLNVDRGAAPAPEQLINWLQDPATPPDYMQLVLEVLAPNSEIETTDLTARMEEATKIADIVEPNFNKPDDELDEFELNHLNLWREQARVRKAKLAKSKAVLGAVAAMMLTNSDPVFSHLSRMFSGPRRFNTADKPANPEKVKTQREQAKAIQMHNWSVEQKRLQKEARKAEKKRNG